MTQDFSTSLLQDKIKYYVEKGLKRGLKQPEINKYAESQVNNWIRLFHPDKEYMIEAEPVNS